MTFHWINFTHQRKAKKLYLFLWNSILKAENSSVVRSIGLSKINVNVEVFLLVTNTVSVIDQIWLISRLTFHQVFFTNKILLFPSKVLFIFDVSQEAKRQGYVTFRFLLYFWSRPVFFLTTGEWGSNFLILWLSSYANDC